MVDKLKEYRELFEQEKLELETASDEPYIAEAVKKYEAELRETLCKQHAEAIASKEAEIQVIDKLIMLETEKLEAQQNQPITENL